jgi:hypothetical protein
MWILNLKDCAPDIVYERAISSLLRGLTSRAGNSFYIHTSGAARVWNVPSIGEDNGQVWDDVADFENLPVNTSHTATDQLVASASIGNVYTATVSPPWVVGVSLSQAHATPLTFPDLMQVISQHGSGFTVCEGENKTSFVDVNALAKLYIALVNNALEVLDSGGSAAVDHNIWGPQAYFFFVSFEMSFLEFIRDEIVAALKKYEIPILKSMDIKQLSLKEATAAVMSRQGAGGELWSGHIAEMFGVSMRLRGTRALKYLGLRSTDDPLVFEKSVAAYFGITNN